MTHHRKPSPAEQKIRAFVQAAKDNTGPGLSHMTKELAAELSVSVPIVLRVMMAISHEDEASGSSPMVAYNEQETERSRSYRRGNSPGKDQPIQYYWFTT